MLHVDSVIKSYGNHQILTDVFVNCKRGEVLGLLGRNGSGKSTLLKIIFGSLRADRKFVKVGNEIVNGLFDNRTLIKYLPQHNFLPNHIRVSTIIHLFCDKQNASIISDHYLIKPHLQKKSKQLSYGERRILEVFLIIYSKAKFVLIDEPFNGIAPLHKDEIKKAIREQCETKGFIVSDHDYANILDLADRMALIHAGGVKYIKDFNDLEHWGYLPTRG